MTKAKKAKKKSKYDIVFKTTLSPDELFKKAITTRIAKKSGKK